MSKAKEVIIALGLVGLLVAFSMIVFQVIRTIQGYNNV